MNITLLSASPKGKNSTSAFCLDLIQRYIKAPAQDKVTYTKITLGDVVPETTDVLVIAVPVYVDCLPAQLISYLENLAAVPRRRFTIYGVTNCGFAEGHQTRWVLEILKQFCAETGDRWGGGIGLGMGGMILSVKSIPDIVPLKTPVANAFKTLCKAIESNSVLPDIILTQFNYGWEAYRNEAQKAWVKAAAKSGLTATDLDARPLTVN